MKPMTKIKRYILVSTLAVLMAGSAHAESFQARALEIENFVGRVEIVTTNGNEVKLDMDAGDGIIDLPQVDVKNGVARIFYSKRVQVRQCNESGRQGYEGKWLQSVSIKLKGGKKRKLSAYPSLRIEVPAGTDLTTKGGVIFGTAGDLGNVDFSVDSCGSFKLGNVSGDLRARINGSGDIKAGDVAGSLEARINGSGDISIMSVSGNTGLRINGSGDIEVQNASNLQASINGSGDIEVGRTRGAVDLGINGSGDIEVAGGTAMPFKANIRGSGDITFEGHASDVKVYISGSGDIVVGSFDGDLDTGGHRIEIEINDGRLHVEG